MSFPGVLCFGNLVVDTLVGPLREPPRYESTLWVESLEQHTGGNGANTSYAIAKLGVPVRLAGFAGRDAFGDFVTARLSEIGVDTKFVQRVDLPTAATVALVNQQGSRALLHRPGASTIAFEAIPEFTPELLAGCTAFHLANPFALPHVRRHGPEMLRRAREAGLRTSMDTGWDSRGEWMGVVGPCLPFVDLLFVNEDEAQRLTGAADAVLASQALQNGGARTVVVKLGDRGCVVDGEHVPGCCVEVVDTTGAGDAFAGGFVAGLQRGMSLFDAARLANAIGALCVTRLGSTAGLRSFEETIAFASR